MKEDKQKKILLIGGSGFIGKNLNEYFSKFKSYKIISISKSETRIKNIEKIIEQKINYIFILSAVSNIELNHKNLDKIFETNSFLVVRILTLLNNKSFSGKIYYFSSGQIYGGKLKSTGFTENSKKDLNTFYSLTKYTSEEICNYFNNSTNLKIITLRLFNIIGKYQSSNFFLPSVIKKIIKQKENQENILKIQNPNSVRDFLDVRDLCEALKLLLNKSVKGEIYNICSSNPQKIKDCIKVICKILNYKPILKYEYLNVKSNKIFGDNSKLSQSINWRPKFKFYQTVKDMIKNSNSNFLDQ